MSSQADVRSIEALKEFRIALALYAEEALGALATASSEAKRTVQWLQHDRKGYWIDQVKRRREGVAMARAEVARRKLAKTSEHTPAFSEQKELLRVAEAALREAEAKAVLVKKWEPLLQQAVLEHHASTRRIADLAGTDVPRALHLLTRLVDALEGYLRVVTPDRPGLAALARTIFDEAEAEAEIQPEPMPSAEPDAPQPVPTEIPFEAE